eukprot:COSAG06_NODE_28052_length_581_cov_2.049793_1_plen_93_part_00
MSVVCCVCVTQGRAFLGRGAPANGEVRLHAGGRGRAVELFIADASVRPEGAGDGPGSSSKLLLPFVLALALLLALRVQLLLVAAARVRVGGG